MLRRIYFIYIGLAFMVSFFIFFPVLFLIILFPRLRKWTGKVNYYWNRLYFWVIFVQMDVERRGVYSKEESYIFCANHSSFFDIPTMAFVPVNFVYVGKNSLSKIPLFGYMFRKLHIAVDRESLRSKQRTMDRAREAIEKNVSLVLFPEGGILTKTPPYLAPLKNGAFKLAIEKQISIVPVTIPYNWIFLPDESKEVFYRKLKVIFHAPISTQGMELKDLEGLKKQYSDIITTELKKELN